MILIALGANLPSPAGPPAVTLDAALHKLAGRGITIMRRSGFYRSTAWPDPTDPAFVNAVAAIATDLTPAALLAALHEVEAEFGRKRGIPNAPRTLDLDLLDYDGRVEEGPPWLPHPRMQARAFVLVPLAEMAPFWRHPVSGQRVGELIAGLPSESVAGVARMEEP
jgi:2-amino-4-hydroxy-6-hydroxymethyldihydropteridine diphosphokinase